MSRPRRRSGTVFLGGRFVAAADARISAFDRGFLYGDGLFETVRIYAGRPFALVEHLERMRFAADRIGLSVPNEPAWWREMIAELLRRNRLSRSDAAVRVTVTRGATGAGLLPPRRSRPTIFAVARRLPRELSSWQRVGVDVTLLPFHPGLDGYLSGLKTTDYLTALVGKAIARERGAFEGIYLTQTGKLLEGTTSNVFIVRRGVVETPPLRHGILAGITRGHVLEVARQARIPVAERPIHARELRTADEAFLTASTIEIVPIRSVEGRRLRRSGNTVARLRELFHR
jgi:branched-chain amino acid aminotransferase